MKKNLCFFALFLFVPLGAAPCRALDSESIFKDILWARISNMPAGERLPVGLALSAGGARGFAHVGVLDVLDKIHFPVDYIGGTSMGAVIGGLYASGLGMGEIWKFAEDTDTRNVEKDFKGIALIKLILKNRLISPKYITAFIEKNLKGVTFSKLKLPFACVAMDFRTGEKIIFTEGDLSLAVRASSNLPGIFRPVKYRHRYLVDGGVVDFLPVDVAEYLGGEWILSVWIESRNDELPNNVLSSLLQVIDIRGKIIAQNSLDKSDFAIIPDVKGIGVADFAKCRLAGLKGVEAAMAVSEKLKSRYISDTIDRSWRYFK